MTQHKTYCIGNTDEFRAGEYLLVTEEVGNLAMQTANLLPAHKADILISFLKDHAIKTAWVNTNQPVTTLITSGVLPTANIEALFAASRENKVFRGQLDAFIRKELLPV